MTRPRHSARPFAGLSALVVAAFAAFLAVTSTGTSEALWVETKDVSAGSVTLIPGCPQGYVYDAFEAACIPPPTLTSWTCSAEHPLDQVNLEQSEAETCVDPADPLDGSSTEKCQIPGAIRGRWTHYITAGSPFTATDKEYTLTLAMPKQWVARAHTAPFRNPQLLIRGRKVDVSDPSTTMWTGRFHPDTVETPENLANGEFTFLDEARTIPVAISVAIERDKGSASNDNALWPAYMLVILDITDENDVVRRVSGVMTTRAVHQGSLDLSCKGNNASKITVWTWEQAELCRLGYGAPSNDPTQSPYCA